MSEIPADILEQIEPTLPTASSEVIPDEIYQQLGLTPPAKTGVEHGARVLLGSIYHGANSAVGSLGDLIDYSSRGKYFPEALKPYVYGGEGGLHFPRSAELEAQDRATLERSPLARMFRGDAPSNPLEQVEAAGIRGATGGALADVLTGGLGAGAMMGGLSGAAAEGIRQSPFDSPGTELAAGGLGLLGGLRGYQMFRPSPVQSVVNALGGGTANAAEAARVGGAELQSVLSAWRTSPGRITIVGRDGVPRQIHSMNSQLNEIGNQFEGEIQRLGGSTPGPYGMPTPNVTSASLPSEFLHMDRALNQVHGGNLGEAIDQLANPIAVRRLRNIYDSWTLTGGFGIPPSLADMMDFRTVIGKARGLPNYGSGNLGKEALNRIYAATNEDINATLRNHFGDEGVEAFSRYNDASSREYDFANGPVKDFLGKLDARGRGTKDPADAFSSLITGMKNGGNARDVEQFRARFPEAMDQVGAAAIASKHLRGENNPLTRSLPQWSELPPSAQEALVPSPRQREILHNSLPFRSAETGLDAEKLASRAFILTDLAGHMLGLPLSSTAGYLIPGGLGFLLGRQLLRGANSLRPASMTALEWGRATRAALSGELGMQNALRGGEPPPSSESQVPEEGNPLLGQTR